MHYISIYMHTRKASVKKSFSGFQKKLITINANRFTESTHTKQEMEQQKAAAKPKSKILKFLPRATSSISFQNSPLFSPNNKDKRSSEKPHKSNLGKGFSGPLVSIVPSANRRKIKNDSAYSLVYEPTSPRVSCMGQVKCKQYQKKLSNVTKVPRTTSFTPERTSNKDDNQEKVVKSKKKLGFGKIFNGGSKTNNKCSKTDLNIPKAPCLSTMKRFSSGRDAFTNFDWTTQITPLDSAQRNYFTDDEKDGGSDCEEIMMPSSAPVMVRNKGVCDNFVRVGGVNLEPKKEINLWKRRTMAQPQPLQLHTT